jgi:hypothetical protein
MSALVAIDALQQLVWHKETAPFATNSTILPQSVGIAFAGLELPNETFSCYSSAGNTSTCPAEPSNVRTSARLFSRLFLKLFSRLFSRLEQSVDLHTCLMLYSLNEGKGGIAACGRGKITGFKKP